MTQEEQQAAPARSRSDQVIRTIVQEHQGLWRIIDLLDQLQQDMNVNANQPDELLFNTIFDYIEHFSKRVHSQPTEIMLYKRLREKAPDTSELLDKLEKGYRVGHERLQELRGLLQNCMSNWPDGREAFSHALTRFTQALRKHIKKEEGVVIPRARESLTQEDWELIADARDQTQDPLFGERVREEFRELRHKIISMTP